MRTSFPHRGTRSRARRNHDVVLAERPRLGRVIEFDDVQDLVSPVVIAAFDAAGVLLGSLSETYPGGYALGKTLTLNFAGARSFVVSSPNQINPHSVYSEISAYAVGGAVPEPSTWAMLILGFGLVGGALRSARAKTGRKQLAVTYA